MLKDAFSLKMHSQLQLYDRYYGYGSKYFSVFTFKFCSNLSMSSNFSPFTDEFQRFIHQNWSRIRNSKRIFWFLGPLSFRSSHTRKENSMITDEDLKGARFTCSMRACLTFNILLIDLYFNLFQALKSFLSSFLDSPMFD